MKIVRFFLVLFLILSYLGVGNIIYQNTHFVEPVKVDGFLLKAFYGPLRHTTDTPNDAYNFLLTVAWPLVLLATGSLFLVLDVIPTIGNFISTNFSLYSLFGISLFAVLFLFLKHKYKNEIDCWRRKFSIRKFKHDVARQRKQRNFPAI